MIRISGQLWFSSKFVRSFGRQWEFKMILQSGSRSALIVQEEGHKYGCSRG